MLAVQDRLRGSIGYSKRAFSANMTSSEFVVLPAFKRPFHDREGVGLGRLNNLQSLEWLVHLRRRFEVGRNVAHFLERRVEQIAGQELLWIRQRLVWRPLPRRDHSQTTRFENRAEQVLGNFRAVSVV